MHDESSLLKAAADHDDVARLAYADWLEERGDARAAWVRDERVFEWMLPDGRDPIAPVLASVRDGDERSQEARAVLPRLGPAVVPHLMDAIRDGGDAAWAGEALGAMGRDAVSPVLAELIRLVGRGDEGVRLPAALALRAAGPAAAPALPALIGLLPGYGQYDHHGHADALAAVFGAIGPAAADAVPGLVRFLSWNSAAASAALVSIGPSAAPGILDEVERLDSGYYILAGPLKELAGANVPLLRHSLGHESPHVRGLAALALAGHDPAAAMPALVEGLAASPGQDEQRDDLYAEAIRDAAAFVRPPVEALHRVLPELGENARGLVAVCLERLGEAGGAVAMLRERLTDPDARRRGGALATLRCLADVPEEAVTAALPLLDDPDSYVRDGAMSLVGHLAAGPRRPLVVPALAAASGHRELNVALWAADELGKLQSPRGREALRSMLKASRHELRLRAVSLLRGPEGDDLAADLPRLLKDRSSAVKAAAMWAYADTGPADAATRAITTGLGSSTAKVRVAALRALAVRGPEGLVDRVLGLAAVGGPREARQAGIDLIPLCGLPADEAVAFLRGRLADADNDIKAVAAFRLADLAEKDPGAAEAAIPDLLALLAGHDNASLRSGAGWALFRIGAAALPGLIAVLRTDDEAARAQACYTLVLGEAFAAGAAEALIDTLASPSVHTRGRAAWALALSVPPGTPPEPLRRLLRGQDDDTTEYAITALARLGAASAWPEVARLISHQKDDVAACVVWAAGRLRPDQAPALWREWLASPRDPVRRMAHLQLSLAGEMEAPSTDDLFELLMVMATREEVTRLIAERAAADAAELAFVRESTTRGSHHRHSGAVTILGRAGHARPVEAADAVIHAMTRMHCTRRDGLHALVAIGPPAAARGLPAVRIAAESEDHEQRGLALALMRRLLAGAGDA